MVKTISVETPEFACLQPMTLVDEEDRTQELVKRWEDSEYHYSAKEVPRSQTMSAHRKEALASVCLVGPWRSCNVDIWYH